MGLQATYGDSGFVIISGACKGTFFHELIDPLFFDLADEYTSVVDINTAETMLCKFTNLQVQSVPLVWLRAADKNTLQAPEQAFGLFRFFGE